MFTALPGEAMRCEAMRGKAQNPQFFSANWELL
jgi:hypothetical protein